MSRRHFLALALNNGLGPKRLAMLEARFPDISACFNLTATALNALGLHERSIQQIIKPRWDLVDKAITWSEKHNQTLLTWHDPLYPFLLKNIPSPPPLLFMKGNISALSMPKIAIVGSRHPSASGFLNAYEFSHALSQENYCITSGLALGVDSRAHQACIDAKGTTIAVLGSGIDCIYPKNHEKLASYITEKGLLISEFPLGSTPKPAHFPQRNRLISGLSLGVIVVEATLRSGSLITARFALEQGREVFAMPSSIHNSQAKGCHSLIKQGAKLIESLSDIFDELPPENRLNQTPKEKKTLKRLEHSLQNLVKFVGYEVTSVETICTKSGLTTESIAHQLIDLELKGIIKAVPGGYLRF